VIELVYEKPSSLHIILDGDSMSNIENLLLKDKAFIGMFSGCSTNLRVALCLVIHMYFLERYLKKLPAHFYIPLK